MHEHCQCYYYAITVGLMLAIFPASCLTVARKVIVCCRRRHVHFQHCCNHCCSAKVEDGSSVIFGAVMALLFTFAGKIFILNS